MKSESEVLSSNRDSFNDDHYINGDDVYFFSPDRKEEAIDLLERHVARATSSVDVCSFLLSDGRLISKLYLKLISGVKIRIILDSQAIHSDTLNSLKRFGTCIKLVRLDNRSFIMHHKFMIIDESILLTGSANFTHTSLRSSGSYENINLFQQRLIVKQFLKEFEDIWSIADIANNKI
ncbi:hypothetical protein GJ496_003795 [Pomphorhynchus laevis]|nr:hypothetical protein GJ496_003795 [Pomphorhynchus laevis]